MKRDSWMLPVGIVLAAALVLGVAPVAPAQDNDNDAEEAECDRAAIWGGPFASADEFGKWMDDLKQPAPWLTLSGDLRLRYIFAPNLMLDRETWHFQRYRVRVGAQVSPHEDIDFNFRMVYEPRYYCRPKGRDVWFLNEAIIDQLNVQWRNMLDLPLTVTFGRQDIILGDGWLVLDGAPLVGSRNIFFDAVRGTIDLPDFQSKLDLIYIDNSASTNRLTPICTDKFDQMEQDERGVIVYLSNETLEATQIDGYFIYKRDMAVHPDALSSDIYTFGSRVVHRIDDNWQARGEGAFQFGKKGGKDLQAFGFTGGVSYHLNDDWDNNFRAGYEYLSGNRRSPTAGKTTQFDPLWGRWPQFSDLYVYPVGLEARPGEVTNLHRVNVGWSSNPLDKLQVCADYHLLFADKNRIGRVSPHVSRGSYFRGQLFSALLRYRLTDWASTHVLGEMFIPGSYYSSERNNVAGFLRYELMFTW